MKTLFVLFAGFLFTFFLGCENTITDPINSETENNNVFSETVAAKDIASYYPQWLKVGGMLLDPSHPLNNTAEMKGLVRYKIEKKFLTSTLAYDKNVFRVSLYIQARIIGGCNGLEHPWTAVLASVDIINSSFVDPVWNLQKVIRVRGTCCCPLNLTLRFKVEDKQLSLYSFALAKVPGVAMIGNGEE